MDNEFDPMYRNKANQFASYAVHDDSNNKKKRVSLKNKIKKLQLNGRFPFGRTVKSPCIVHFVVSCGFRRARCCIWKESLRNIQPYIQYINRTCAHEATAAERGRRRRQRRQCRRRRKRRRWKHCKLRNTRELNGHQISDDIHFTVTLIETVLIKCQRETVFRPLVCTTTSTDLNDRSWRSFSGKKNTVRDISLPPLTKSSRSGLIEIVSKSARNFKRTTQDKRLLTSESRNRLKTDSHTARRKTGHTGRHDTNGSRTGRGEKSWGHTVMVLWH